jgi:hypothetical protein
MKKKLITLPKRLKKTRRNNFRGKFFLSTKVQKSDTLLDILKSTLKKKKKRKARIAGRNLYVMSMRKLVAFQRHYSFFMLRYAF